MRHTHIHKRTLTRSLHFYQSNPRTWSAASLFIPFYFLHHLWPWLAETGASSRHEDKKRRVSVFARVCPPRWDDRIRLVGCWDDRERARAPLIKYTGPRTYVVVASDETTLAWMTAGAINDDARTCAKERVPGRILFGDYFWVLFGTLGVIIF